MINFKEQAEQCAKLIVAHRNKGERERCKKTIDYIRDKLLVHFKRTDERCGDLLAKVTDIDCVKERDNNVKEYHLAVRERNAFRTALEILSDVPAFCPIVRENETWDGEVYYRVVDLATRFADVARADEKKRASRRATAKRLRSRAAAKKSIKRK
jgi:hypothetical protein